MDQHEYHEAIFPQLENSFDHSNHVLGYGPELIKRGWDPNKLLVTVEPVENLHDLAVVQGLEVFVPVCGRNESVMAPVDFEIFLSHENYQLYGSEGSLWHYHHKHILPISDFFEAFLQERNIPYLLDLTPSGGHVLFHVEKDTPAYASLASIGWLEQELINAYNFHDPTDLKRNPPPSFEQGSVFSGIGRLWHYISLLAKEEFKEHDIPVTICDSEEKCVNLDNSWQADSAFMRIMRAPASLHKKNLHKYQMGDSPLTDVTKSVFDGFNYVNREEDLKLLTEAMWNLERAAVHAQGFDGRIPVADGGISRLVEEYKSTKLYRAISEFDNTPSLPFGEAFHRARYDRRLSDKTRSVLDIPYPRLLQPNIIRKFVKDLLLEGHWAPKHIADVIHEAYTTRGSDWHTNWMKYPAHTRANYWARAYATVILQEEGEDLLSHIEE